MKIHKRQKCPKCGRFIFNADIELPFEIKSTGAVIMAVSMDINCGHCHESNVYKINMNVAKPIRIDK